MQYMCIQSENELMRKLSELNHLNNSRKINQPRFYKVVVSENRLVKSILNMVKKHKKNVHRIRQEST